MPDVFWATAGGLGLTGIVLEATLRLIRVETSLMRVDTERASNLDDVMTPMTERDDAYQYSVAWADLLARGSSMGRSVLTRGDHARRSEVPAGKRGEPLAFARDHGWAPRREYRRSATPGRCGGAQRGVVPQGTHGTTRRDPHHLELLPPARRRPEVEPDLRPSRLPAIPVRRPGRPAGHGPGQPAAALGRTLPGVPRDPQTLRCPARLPVISAAGLHLGPRRTDNDARPGGVAQRPRTSWW